MEKRRAGKRSWLGNLYSGLLFLTALNAAALEGGIRGTVAEVLPGAAPFGESDWMFSPEFGLFYPVEGTEWVFHRDLGFLLIRPDGDEGFYYYQPGFGWLWTRSDLLPYFYRYSLESWGYWHRSPLRRSSERFFYYFFGVNQWIGYEPQLPTEGFPYRWAPSDEDERIPEILAERPSLTLEGPMRLSPGEEGLFTVGGPESPAISGVIHWGDGAYTEIDGPGEYTHIYDFEGVFPVTLRHLGGSPQLRMLDVEVAPEPTLLLHSVDLQFDFGGGPSGSRSTLFIGEGAGQDSRLAAIVTYTTPEDAMADLSFQLLSPTGQRVSLGTLSAELPASEPGSPEGPLSATFFIQTDLPISGEGIYAIHADTDAPFIPSSGGSPGSLAYYGSEIDDFTDICRELEITLMSMEAELAQKEQELENLRGRLKRLEADLKAKKEECAELAKTVTDRQQEKTDAETALADAIDAFESRYPRWRLVRAGEGESLADKQKEMEDEMFEHLRDLSSPALPTYASRVGGGSVGAFPVQHGYQQDLGIFTYDAQPDNPFVFDRQVRLDRNMNRAFWARLDAIAEAELELEAACNAVEAAEAAKARCDGEIEKIEEDIGEIEAAIADCLAEIEAKRAEIEELLQQAGECEAQLRALIELERENRRQIRQLQRDLDRARRDAEVAGRGPGIVRDQIDRKAGRAEDLDADREEMNDAEGKANEAKEDLDRAANDLEGARAATEAGNPTQAQQLIDQARQRIEAARAKALEARQSVGRVLGRTNSRPRRQCEDGAEETGPWSSPRFVPTRVVDIGIAPQGSTPEEWASAKEQGRGVLNTIFTVIAVADAIQDPAGFVSDSIAGELIDEALEALGGEDIVLSYDMQFMANLIYDSFITMFEQTRMLEIHVRIEGYRYRQRIDRICVDGQWVLLPPVREIVDDPYQRTRILGPIETGPPEARREAIKNTIRRFLAHTGLQAPGEIPTAIGE